MQNLKKLFINKLSIDTILTKYFPKRLMRQILNLKNILYFHIYVIFRKSLHL